MRRFESKYLPILPLSLSAALALPTLTSCAEKANAEETKPNIIFILCDDMGYGDLGSYGQPYISTPNIDSLARRGVRFTQAYAGSPVSAPSRATLMTGQHSGHTHVRGNREYWRNAPRVMYGDNEDYSVAGQEPYDTARVIIPEILKDNGYTTGLFGKWAGGYEGSESTPDKRGIDNFYGYICQFQAHSYFPNFLNRYDPSEGDTAVVRVVMEDNILYPMFGEEYAGRSQYSADMIHNRAMDWIASQDSTKPFVAFLTYTLPHAELYQPDDSLLNIYREKFDEDFDWPGQKDSRYNATKDVHAQFAAMITRLDSYVGELMSLLDEKGIAENTVIMFASDNGPHEEGGADPQFFGRDGKLRGLKRQCYEGGIRIPFIVSWPGHIEEGVESDHQLAFYDIMPTLCDIAGIEMTDYIVGKPDGISFMPTLTGKDQPLHDYLYWEFHETDQIAVRQGDWKMVVVEGEPRLYNLADDISETNDVASLYPEIVDKLVEVVYEAHVPSEIFKVTLPRKNSI